MDVSRSHTVIPLYNENENENIKPKIIIASTLLTKYSKKTIQY